MKIKTKENGELNFSLVEGVETIIPFRDVERFVSELYPLYYEEWENGELKKSLDYSQISVIEDAIQKEKIKNAFQTTF